MSEEVDINREDFVREAQIYSWGIESFLFPELETQQQRDWWKFEIEQAVRHGMKRQTEILSEQCPDKNTLAKIVRLYDGWCYDECHKSFEEFAKENWNNYG